MCAGHGVTRRAPAGSLLTIGYTFSPNQNNGNILTQTINDGVNPVKTQSYGYDAVNRLATASEGSTWSQTYVYDSFGNRALLSSSNDPSTGMDKVLLATTASTSSVPFSGNRWTATGVKYDNGVTNGRGNLTDVPLDANNSYHAVFDAENRNTSVIALLGGTSQTINYSYDGDGKRVQKSIVGGPTTTFVYDAQGHLAAEYGGNNADSGTQYLTGDHLGSTRLVSTIANGVASPRSRSDYLPFGQEIPSSWNRPNNQLDASQRIKFTAKERDAETGLDFFGARYMSSAQGRFTSPDPTFMTRQRISDPQQLNLYAYTRNNPLKYLDPDGHELKLSIYYNGLDKKVAEHAANIAVAKLQGAGVKNVSFELTAGSPSGLTSFIYDVGPTPHSHLLEFRNGKEATNWSTTSIQEGNAGQNFGGDSAVDVKWAARQNTNETDLAQALGNEGAHEVAHDAVDPLYHLSHPDSKDLMQKDGAADPAWMKNPNLGFAPDAAAALRNKFNRPGEKEKKRDGEPQ